MKQHLVERELTSEGPLRSGVRKGRRALRRIAEAPVFWKKKGSGG